MLFFCSYLLNFVCFICLGNVFLSLVEVFFYDFVWSVPLTWLDCSHHTVFRECYVHFHRTHEYLAGELFHCLNFHVCVLVMRYSRVTCRLLLLILSDEGQGRLGQSMGCIGQVGPKGWLWLRWTQGWAVYRTCISV